MNKTQKIINNTQKNMELEKARQSGKWYDDQIKDIDRISEELSIQCQDYEHMNHDPDEFKFIRTFY